MKIKITLTALIISICSYSQCKSGDCDNGKGVYEFVGGDYFQGEFKNGNIFKGKIIFKVTGTIQEGTFINNKLNGPNCKITTNDQIKSGTFKEGKLISGFIIQDDKEGTSKWEGKFNENGFLTGEGTFNRTNSKGKYTLEGNFKNDTLNDDNGYILYPDKSFYKGEIKDDLPDGMGVLTFPNGSTEKGLFLDGVFQMGLDEQKSLDDNTTVIQLEYDSSRRVYYIYVEIGGTKIKTIFDTGASFLSIDKEYLYSAKKQNLVSEISKITTSDANNNKTSNDLYLLKNLNVLTKNDKMLSIPYVPAIGKSEGKPSLFGVGALKQLGSKFIVDFENNQINIIQ